MSSSHLVDERLTVDCDRECQRTVRFGCPHDQWAGKRSGSPYEHSEQSKPVHRGRVPRGRVVRLLKVAESIYKYAENTDRELMATRPGHVRPFYESSGEQSKVRTCAGACNIHMNAIDHPRAIFTRAEAVMRVLRDLC